MGQTHSGVVFAFLFNKLCKHRWHSKYLNKQNTRTHQSVWLSGLCSDAEFQRAPKCLGTQLRHLQVDSRESWDKRNGAPVSVNRERGFAVMSVWDTWLYARVSRERESNGAASFWSDCSDCRVESRP